jgi:hypothetical protein
MRRWGMVISAFYALILLVLLLPVFLLLAQSQYYSLSQFLSDLAETYGVWETWVVLAVLCSGQALLLFLSVDTTQRRLKPRAHIFLTCLAASSLTAVLTFAVIGAIGVAVQGDKFGEGSFANPFIFFGGLWVVWGVLFYLYLRNSSEIINHIVSWLLKGSILEMLVAIPCHIIVRRRHECSAPAVTSFGIVTGIAIMLISFGPSVLFLYKKRLDTYATRSST